MTKKFISSLLTIIVILSFMLAACTPPAPTEAPKPAATTAGGSAPAATKAPAPAATTAPVAGGKEPVTAANEFPIVKNPITLKIMIQPTSMIKDFKNNEFTKWVEQKTNIKLDLIVPPLAEARQKLNLVLASDDLPDMIMNFGITLDTQQVLAEQGVIIPLNDLIEKYGYEFKTVLKDVPETKNAISLLDGKIYGLPHINDCYHCTMSQKMWVYKPWLDKLGLKEPETTEEFYQMLKAFKEKDPNGNGKADEIPLSGGMQALSGTGWQTQLDSYLMNAFVYNDRVTPNMRHLYQDNGVIKASFVQPGWKEGLKYLAKLYSEGLVDPQAFTNDSNKIRQLGENPSINVMGASSAGWYGVITANGGPSGRWKEFIPIKPLKGPSGLQAVPRTPYYLFGQGSIVITKACKNPEAAFRLADLFYGFDATTRSVFGPEGEDWVRAKADDVSINAGKAQYTVLKVWSGEEHNRHWNQAAPTFRTNNYRMAQTYNPADPLERWLFEWTRDKYQPFGVTDKAIPPLVFTKDQSKAYGEYFTTVYGVNDEWFAKFVTGQANVDKDWDTYIKALNDAGLEKFLKIYQDSYNAKFKK